jgi:hypothetical protein
VVENVGEGVENHALMPSSEVVLGAESCLERRATEVVKLSNCDLTGTCRIAGQALREIHARTARIAELNRFATIDQLTSGRLRHCASARVVAGDNWRVELL